MKRFPDVVGSITALTLLLTLFSLPARADLAAEVNAILQDKLLRRATVGIQVYRLGATSAGEGAYPEEWR